jgi:hypothetical protein
VSLNNRRRVFVEEYLKCWNASESARRAGYKGKSNVAGPRLLANDSIKAEIERRLDELKMSADEVLVRLADQARASSGQFIDEHGHIDWAKVKEQGHLIKGISQTSRGDKIELHDVQGALQLIGKHHGLFADDKVVTLKLEKELETVLDTLAKVLSKDDYQRILVALGGEPAGETEARGEAAG